MVLQPRTIEEIKTDLATDLDDEVYGLTDFEPGSFNDRFLEAYAEQIREAEIKALAGELAGYPRYAGKTLTQADLDALGVDTVAPSEVNEYMVDDQLDQLAVQVGVTRDDGSKATGQVTFTVTDDTVSIPEGFEVGTEPDTDGSYESFYVDADGDGTIESGSTATVSPASGSTTVTADVIAGSVGIEFNVGSGAITYLPTPEPGVQSVTNDSATTGGEDVQSNESLRNDVTNALFVASGGGTERGIEEYIIANDDDVEDVEVIQFTNKSPPFADVVVDGGTDSSVTDLINESRPTGIEHNLVRPTRLRIGTYVQVVGDGIDTADVDDQIQSYLDGLGLNETFSQSRLLSVILGADSNIVSAPSVTTYTDIVTDELHTYQSGTSVYDLTSGPLGEVNREQHRYATGKDIYRLTFDGVDSSTVTVKAIVGNERVTLTQGASNDYEVIDESGDGRLDAIELTGNTLPDDGSVMEVSYGHDNGVVDSVDTVDGTSFTKGTDYAVIDADSDGFDDAIDFSVGGSSPADGERFLIDYRPFRSFGSDQSAAEREKFDPDVNLIDVESQPL